MEFRPHKYQDYAREFIIGHPVCALILDMGLGKTVITLTALWELALDYFEVGKVLSTMKVQTESLPSVPEHHFPLGTVENTNEALPEDSLFHRQIWHIFWQAPHSSLPLPGTDCR